MPSNPSIQDTESGARDPAVRVYRPAVTPAEKGETVAEVGGRKDGTEPTRFGDWEKQGRCIDF